MLIQLYCSLQINIAFTKAVVFATFLVESCRTDCWDMSRHDSQQELGTEDPQSDASFTPQQLN